MRDRHISLGLILVPERAKHRYLPVILYSYSLLGSGRYRDIVTSSDKKILITWWFFMRNIGSSSPKLWQTKKKYRSCLKTSVFLSYAIVGYMLSNTKASFQPYHSISFTFIGTVELVRSATKVGHSKYYKLVKRFSDLYHINE